jgi:hypothetical protein
VAANTSLLSSRDKAVIREVSKAAWTAELDLSFITDGPARAAGPFMCGIAVYGAVQRMRTRFLFERAGL